MADSSASRSLNNRVFTRIEPDGKIGLVQLYAEFADGTIKALFWGTDYFSGEITGKRDGDSMKLEFVGHKRDGTDLPGTCQTTITWEDGVPTLHEVFPVGDEVVTSTLQEAPDFNLLTGPLPETVDFLKVVRSAHDTLRTQER